MDLQDALAKGEDERIRRHRGEEGVTGGEACVVQDQRKVSADAASGWSGVRIQCYGNALEDGINHAAGSGGIRWRRRADNQVGQDGDITQSQRGFSELGDEKISNSPAQSGGNESRADHEGRKDQPGGRAGVAAEQGT